MRLFVFVGVSGFLAVFLGAFGSHVLKASLGEKFFSVFQTANQYHFWHTLTLLALAILMLSRPHKFLKMSATFFITGRLLFSGNLYVYAMSTERIFAMLAPLGGVSLMLGWLFFVWGSIRIFGQG
jgi:uncharacterized membrane protein YgdD (TMEM256/DUF423 family)